MANYAYLIADTDTKVCAVVDPGWDAEIILAEAKSENWRIEKILLTHTHFDHTNDVKKLFDITGAKVYVHESEASELSDINDVITTKEGSKIEVGNLEITCLHTPGHSPGSQCFLVDDVIITGDTLFVDACGRVDLPGGNPKQMMESLKKISMLDPNIVVYPGHAYGASNKSTIGDQRKTNPYLNENSQEVFY